MRGFFDIFTPSKKMIHLSEACKMKLFTMPSGDVLCHVDHNVQRTFDDAQAFCQDMGLQGLVEPKVPKGKKMEN
jgi:hypothetical protein